MGWPTRPGVATVVIKRTFRLASRGLGAVAQEQVPLTLDQVARDGTILVPTDFAPTKSSCDVVLVGSGLLDPRGPVRLVVDPLRKLVERASDLGARPGVGLLGDPTHPSVARAWSSATFDFEAFQAAERGRRVPFVTFPFDVILDVAEERFVTRIEGPVPEVMLLDERGWEAPVPVALRADTLAVDPSERTVSVTWRGLIDVPQGSEPILAVDLDTAFRGTSPREILRWSRVDAVEPDLLRRLGSLVGERTGGLAIAGVGGAPFGTTARHVVTPAGGSVADTSWSDPTPEPEPPTAPPQKLHGEPSASGTRPPSGTWHDERSASGTLPPSAMQGERSAPDTLPPWVPDVDEMAGEEVLGTSTVSLTVPSALRGDALPFDGRSNARSRVVPVGGGQALPFAPPSTSPSPRVERDDERPTGRPPPMSASASMPFEPAPAREPRRPMMTMLGPNDDAVLGTSTQTTAIPAGLRALPFTAVAAAVGPPQVTPSTTGLPFGARTGTLTHEAGDGAFPPRVPPPPLVAAPPTAPPFAPPPMLAGRMLGDLNPNAGASTTPAVSSLWPVGRAPSIVVEGRVAAPVLAAAAAAETTPGGPRRLTREQFVEIQAALWAHRGSRRELLAEHSFTELSWRLAERRFVKHLAEQPRHEQILEIVSHLQEQVRRGAPVDGEPP